MEEVGLRAGRDVAIVGAGNIHYGDMLRVPLTTISWSRGEMGHLAAQMLIELIENGSPVKAKQVILPPELIVRSSCGAKPTAKIRSSVRLGGYAMKR